MVERVNKDRTLEHETQKSKIGQGCKIVEMLVGQFMATR